jgi:hypothetical protein
MHIFNAIKLYLNWSIIKPLHQRTHCLNNQDFLPLFVSPHQWDKRQLSRMTAKKMMRIKVNV